MPGQKYVLAARCAYATGCISGLLIMDCGPVIKVAGWSRFCADYATGCMTMVLDSIEDWYNVQLLTQ
jgi:hypothetical protein